MATTRLPNEDDVDEFLRVIGTWNRLRILRGLDGRDEAVTLRELAGDVGMIPSHIRSLIGLLVETGLVTEVEAGRGTQADSAYQLTDAGERVVKEIAQPVEAFIADTFEVGEA